MCPFSLKATSQEAEVVRREQSVWERKVGEVQALCSTLEAEKYEALAKVRESVQAAEEAVLQKDEVRHGPRNPFGLVLFTGLPSMHLSIDTIFDTFFEILS